MRPQLPGDGSQPRAARPGPVGKPETALPSLIPLCFDGMGVVFVWHARPLVSVEVIEVSVFVKIPSVSSILSLQLVFVLVNWVPWALVVHQHKGCPVIRTV